MGMVKRTKVVTKATVVEPGGNVVGSIERYGNICAARLANVARREFENALVTVVDVTNDKTTYGMDEDKFFAEAAIIDENTEKE